MFAWATLSIAGIMTDGACAGDLSDGISIKSEQLSQPSPPAETLFTRIEGGEIGIYRPVEYSIRDHWPPFWNGRGISSGDIDRDGDSDIVLGSSDRGVHIFENLGDGTFKEITPEFPSLVNLPIIIAALVDIDNDGWLDIFTTAYQSGNRVLWNRGGTYSEEHLTLIKNRKDAVLTKALAFGDVDRDGDLDAVIGNWAAGWYRHVPGPEAINRVIFNHGVETFGEEFIELLGMPGETLSLLLSDFNMDGSLDLLVGNDFKQPDIFYIGDGKGGFRQIRPGDGFIPYSTTTTMSLKTGDLDNDLVPEIYISQIAGKAEGIRDSLMMQPADLYCSDINHDDDRKQCQLNVDVRKWYKVGGRRAPIAEAQRCRDGPPEFESRCKAMMIKDVAIQRKDPTICNHITEDQPRALLLCEIHFRPSIRPTKEQYMNEIPQVLGRNVLLKAEGGSYQDVAEEWDVAIGGWSWDVKITDLDLNEYQDLYVTNGFWSLDRAMPSNLFFSNSGTKIVDKTAESGLTEFLILPSVTTVDIDNDGDLDLMGQVVNGPVMAFINNTQVENRIVFRFQDRVGNTYGIGTKLVVRYGADGEKRQMREIQASGGFLSFDSAGAFFGLGESAEVQEIEIEWSTGERSVVAGPFAAGQVHTIQRSEQ